MNKLTIAVIFGGCSDEHEISLRSAAAVLEVIDHTLYEVIALGISRAGAWYCYQGPPEHIVADTWLQPQFCQAACIVPDRARCGLLRETPGGPEWLKLDAAWPLLHGHNGEDGTIQGLLQMAGIKIIGPGLTACALGMDKDISHRLAAAVGCTVPRGLVWRAGEEIAPLRSALAEIGYPLIVKPLSSGSSLGISQVDDQQALPAALELALRYDQAVLIEEKITGRELGCALLQQGDTVRLGQLDEIIYTRGLLDYQTKYYGREPHVRVPAEITTTMACELQQQALKIYQALRCTGFARIDFFLSDSGQLYFNEINTIPGFTSHSRFPRMMAAAGYDFAALVAAVLRQGVV